MRPSNGFGGPLGPMNQPGVVEHMRVHGGHPFGWLLLFILLALVVALVVWVALRVMGARAAQHGVVSGPVDNALDVVRLRYAQGEIDRKEFLRMIGDLGGPPQPPAPSV